MYGMELLTASNEATSELISKAVTAVETNDLAELRSVGNKAWFLSDNYSYGPNRQGHDLAVCMALHALGQWLYSDDNTYKSAYFKYLAIAELFPNKFSYMDTDSYSVISRARTLKEIYRRGDE